MLTREEYMQMVKVALAAGGFCPPPPDIPTPRRKTRKGGTR